MKIYFAGSIRGGREDAAIYLKIIDHLRKYGTVLTEHVGTSTLSSSGEAHMSDKDIHNRDMDWLMQADVVVAEVSVPSLGVGYEVGRAIENNKRVLTLYRPQDGRRLSAMIAGARDLTNTRYRTMEDVILIIDVYFNRE